MTTLSEDFNDPELMVSPEMKEQRLITCINCSNYTEISTCKECDCFVGIMVAYNFKSCPIGKW